MKCLFRLLLLICPLFLLGCEQQQSQQDVHDFIAEAKRKPTGKISPLPVYTPYKPHSYDATGLRSPFSPPVVEQKKVIIIKSNVKPDLTRRKQRLENFEFGGLSMVGSINKDNVLWVLIRDPEGSIEPVREGYYVGKNHGKITNVSDLRVDVIEIVPDGQDGWIERPNAIKIKE